MLQLAQVLALAAAMPARYRVLVLLVVSRLAGKGAPYLACRLRTSDNEWSSEGDLMCTPGRKASCGTRSGAARSEARTCAASRRSRLLGDQRRDRQ